MGHFPHGEEKKQHLDSLPVGPDNFDEIRLVAPLTCHFDPPTVWPR